MPRSILSQWLLSPSQAVFLSFRGTDRRLSSLQISTTVTLVSNSPTQGFFKQALEPLFVTSENKIMPGLFNVDRDTTINTLLDLIKQPLVPPPQRPLLPYRQDPNLVPSMDHRN